MKFFKSGWCLLAGLLLCCSKNHNNTPGSPGGVINPEDPPVAATAGFFMTDWSEKRFTAPSATDTNLSATPGTVNITIDAGTVLTKVNPAVFGQNANSWMTQMLTEPSLMNNLSQLHPNIIRFPGGSISDVYFWNADPGSPPADAPDSLLDANGVKVPAGYWFGKNSASWTISVNNYYSMLQQTGNQGMITVNYAYARYGTGPNPVAAAAHLAADWVRYDNGRTKYWEVGNEDNGTWEAGYRINTATNHDAQTPIITGDLYGKHFKVFADSMKQAAKQTGKTIYIGAQLLEKQPESWQTPTDQSWNAGVLAQTGNIPDYYIIHSYFTNYKENSSASVILNTASNNTAAMMSYLKNSFTNAGVAPKPVALTEWNITSEGSMQQVSFVNGMHAAIMLGELIKNNYGEASRWDLANGWNNGNDHGLFNIGDEPGATKWNPRPAFYYMYYFGKMIGDRLLSTSVTGSSDVLAYGSSFSSGEKGIIIVNKAAAAQTVNISLQHAAPLSQCYWYTLTGGTDNGEFSRKVFVNGKGPDGVSGGPSDYASIKAHRAALGNNIHLTLAARSVVYMVIGK